MSTLFFWSVEALVQLLLTSAFDVQHDAFTLPKYGQRLIGKEIKAIQTESTFFCANDCVRLEDCLAYNYVETNGTCQLMDTNDMTKTEPDPEYQIVLKKITCKKEPCEYNGTCHDGGTMVHGIEGYRCSCPCGRCGKRCEKVHFGHIEKACIYQYNAGYKQVKDPDECMAFCWETQGCRSADYIEKNGDCWLNSVTSDEEPLMYDCDEIINGVSFLFFNCTCN